MSSNLSAACCHFLFALDILEGKYWPKELGKRLHDEKGGKTVGLLLWLCKNLNNTGKVFLLDL